MLLPEFFLTHSELIVEFKESKQPYFVAGAGELVSHVHRNRAGHNSLHYRFNIFRIDKKGEATNWLRPGDLRDIVKACQVLAFSIADDGWVEDSIREQLSELAELAEELQLITDSWEDNDAQH